MPTREEWEKVHADLMARLRLPCTLRFTTKIRIGQHIREDSYEFWGSQRRCYIDVNLEADFHVPAHLILHEGAHHRADASDDYHGHDMMWAHTLLAMYEETGIALPQSTAFESFAKVAGIRHRAPDEALKDPAAYASEWAASATYPVTGNERLRLRRKGGYFV